MDNNKPADVIRDGSLKATIWENHSDKGSYFTTTLAKTYEDKDGKLKDTHSFSGPDLLRIAELARQAYTRTGDLRRDLKQEQAHMQESGYGDAQRNTYQGRRAQQSQGSGRHNGRGRSAGSLSEHYFEPSR